VGATRAFLQSIAPRVPTYYSFSSHVIFFRLTDSGIVAVRILQERMDFERHL
jgi:plasmid stabilization system protein ParE